MVKKENEITEKMIKNNPYIGSTFREFLEEQLKDEEFRKEFEKNQKEQREKIKLKFYPNKSIFKIKNLIKKGIKLFISIEAIEDYYHISNQEIDKIFLKSKLVDDKEFLDKIYSSIRKMNPVSKKDKELLITSDILND